MQGASVVALFAMVCLLVSGPEETLSQCERGHQPDGEGVVCDRVQEETCRQVGYENTSFPTPLYRTPTMPSGDITFNSLSLLLYLDCAKYVPVKHFICSAAFPLCIPDLFQRIGPCREFCVSIRESCIQDLMSYGVEWPPALDCSQYAPYGTAICVWDGSAAPSICDGDDTGTPPSFTTPTTSSSPDTNEGTTSSSSRNTCPDELVSHPNGSGVEFGGIKDCGEPCHGAFFDKDQQNFALIWVTTWSLACLVVSVVSFLTYILNFRKIRSPESPIYYLALCYSFLALAYMVSIAVGREELFCDSDLMSGKNESALAADGFEVPLCAMIFSVLYYFSMCSWTWWAVLATQWFLCTIRQTSISYKVNICCHLVGWGAPLIFVLTALPLKLVSGDPVLRTCWLSKEHELWLLILPLGLLVVYSSLVIIVTYARLIHTQRHTKLMDISPRADDLSLDVLIRVGLYVAVYLLPMGLLFSCFWYRYFYRKDWEDWLIECSVDGTSDCGADRRPQFSVFMIQFAASIVMGIATAIWVAANRDTFAAWRRAFCILQDRNNDSETPDPGSPFVFTESSV